MRISDWSSDVCSSDLDPGTGHCGVLDERTRCSRTYQPLFVLQPDREQGHGPLHPSASRNRSHNQFAQQADPNFDPLSYAFDMGDLAVEFYVSDPDFFRPLLRFLFGVSDAELRPAFMNKGVRHWHAV